jgi:hypothetical protein
MAEAAQMVGVSTSTLKKAKSHGLIRFSYIGDKPLISMAEVERIASEGLKIPRGYKRNSAVTGKGGRPREPEAKAKSTPRRKREAERERRAAP